jgi:redox-sensitive bicupin YhaK (pirin superfamily)
MGNGSVIRPGDVQMMSAGTGVAHSEFNHSRTAPVHLLQIWIAPNQNGVEPRYQQVHFSAEEKRGKLRLIISPNGENGSLSVYQDAKVYAGLIDGEETFQYPLTRKRYAYVHVARGDVRLNDQELKAGDGVRVRDEELLWFSNGKDAEILLFDLATKEIPDLRQ